MSDSTKKGHVYWGNPGHMPSRYGFVRRKDYRKALKKLGCEPHPTPNSDACVELFCVNNTDVCLFSIDEDLVDSSSDVAVIGMVTHEAVHIFQFMCADVGEKDPSPEFEAYTIQAITQHLLWAMEEAGVFVLGA